MFARSCLAGILLAGAVLSPVVTGSELVSPPAGEPLEVVSPTGTVTLQVGHQKLLRTKAKVQRLAVVDAQVCDAIPFTPGQVSLVGRGVGKTQVTFWFDDPAMAPLVWTVEVK
jgi:Flp pilus assembly secretin CpaC